MWTAKCNQWLQNCNNSHSKADDWMRIGQRNKSQCAKLDDHQNKCSNCQANHQHLDGPMELRWGSIKKIADLDFSSKGNFHNTSKFVHDTYKKPQLGSTWLGIRIPCFEIPSKKYSQRGQKHPSPNHQTSMQLD